ncbi:hypothetical protein TRFO_41616 [Tritrichomonas foetus]|uniref:Viral A-type inclusion protein n=1 Tax=Tritrichomonas foetus TaxID=1144522 RepID=A0A1J4KZS1_9EUKA|nr:hypothetical protein TRFO_41616 [Tritrichomonas foetus]|eukprot:OHT16747.1 hypothetical protein TRFO_41616 [Tritrichomonas foetus]
MKKKNSSMTDNLEELGEQILINHLSGSIDSPIKTTQSDELNKLNSIVTDLSRFLRKVSKNPTPEQLQQIETVAYELSGKLNSIQKIPDSDYANIHKISDAYKVLSCALLLIHKHQQHFDYKQKYEDLKNEFDMQEKLHRAEIESFKEKHFKIHNSISDLNNSLEDKNEVNLLKREFEKYQMKVDKTISSIQIMMQLPETTTLKTLKSEISAKLKKIKQKNNSNSFSADSNNNHYLEQERMMNENLRRKIKEVTDQCIAAHASEQQKEEENRRLKDSIIMHESQITSLIKEKDELQKAVDTLADQNNDLKQASELNDQQDKIFIMQTDLSSANVKYSEAIDKIGRLKAKLERMKKENNKLKDEQTKMKDSIECLQLDIQQTKIENEELQNEIKTKISLKSSNDEILSKNEEIGNLNIALDNLAQQLSSQIEEVSKGHQLKEKLVYYLQKQSEIISSFSKESSDLQSRVDKLDLDNRDKTALLKQFEEENTKYKSFMNGFSRLVSINMTPDIGAPIIGAIDKLQLEGLNNLFYFEKLNSSNGSFNNSLNGNSNNSLNNMNENNKTSQLVDNSLNERLFQYIEDQVNILQSIASNDFLGHNKKVSILKSCQDADKFVKQIAPDFYNEPSIFSSFGLIVDPSTLSTSLKNFLNTFKTVSSPESRELFDIAKQAIAMNSLLRSIALLLRHESEKVYHEMQKAVDNLSDIRESESTDAENRVSEVQRQLNSALKAKDMESRKLTSLKRSLGKLIEKGVSIPPKIAQDLLQDGSFELDSSEIEPDFSQNSNNNTNTASNGSNNNDSHSEAHDIIFKSPQPTSPDNIESLKAKLAKSQKNVKILKEKIALLVKRMEKSKKKSQAASIKAKEEKEQLLKSITEIQTEFEKIEAENKGKISNLQETLKQKLAEQQQAAARELTTQIDKLRVEYKAQLKHRSLELKEKIKKSNEICESQIQRADSLKKHYETLLQTLRDKLNNARKAELQAKDESSALETEVKQLKSKLANLVVDNKMLSLKLSTAEDRNKRENSVIDSQVKMQQIAADTKLEEKINELERANNHFFSRMRDLLKDYSQMTEITNFETTENVIKKIITDIIEMKSRIEVLGDAQSEMNRIRALISPKANITTFSAVSTTIRKLNEQIEELKETNDESWRNWAIKILGKTEDDEIMMNDLEHMMKSDNSQNSDSFMPKLSPEKCEPNVKTLIDAMEAIGRKSAQQRESKKLWPIISPM